MMKINKYFFIIIIFYIIGCADVENKTPTLVVDTSVNVDSIQNLPADKKLFLDFATGITKAQFIVLINLLKENKKIDTDGYYQIYLNEEISLKSLIVTAFAYFPATIPHSPNPAPHSNTDCSRKSNASFLTRKRDRMTAEDHSKYPTAC